MARGLWKTLESFAESHPPAAVLAAWQHHTGAEFGTMENFLRPTSRLAQLYPCVSEKGCGDPHEVVALEDGRWLARSQEDMRYCPAIWLTEPELAIHELDVDCLGGELCRVLGFEPATRHGASEVAPKLWPTGTFSATQSPVYLALCPNEGQLLSNLQCLLSICREPFVLLAPTARHRSELIGAMLNRERCVFIPLASCLTPDGAGFRLIASTQPVLDRFTAECVPMLAPRANVAMTAGTPAQLVTDSKSARISKMRHVPISGSHGRLRWENHFNATWLGNNLYNLQTRKRARYCLQFLVGWEAYDESSARHLETEIDLYVRKQAKMPPLPDSSKYNLRIQQYFTSPQKKYNNLCNELIKSAGNGRYYLHTL